MAHWTTYKQQQQLRAAMVARARSYVGVRYRHQGHVRETGVDCLGLLVSLATDFGFEFGLNLDDKNYSMDPNGYRLVERLGQEMDQLEDWRAAQAGDVVLMRWHLERPPQHVGIVTTIEPSNLVCVHASRKARRTAETRWDREDLVTHGFRIRELTNFKDQL